MYSLHIRNDDFTALFGKSLRDSFTETTATASDYGHFASKTSADDFRVRNSRLHDVCVIWYQSEKLRNTLTDVILRTR